MKSEMGGRVYGILNEYKMSDRRSAEAYWKSVKFQNRFLCTWFIGYVRELLARCIKKIMSNNRDIQKMREANPVISKGSITILRTFGTNKNMNFKWVIKRCCHNFDVALFSLSVLKLLGRVTESLPWSIFFNNNIYNLCGVMLQFLFVFLIYIFISFSAT